MEEVLDPGDVELVGLFWTGVGRPIRSAITVAASNGRDTGTKAPLEIYAGAFLGGKGTTSTSTYKVEVGLCEFAKQLNIRKKALVLGYMNLSLV